MGMVDTKRNGLVFETGDTIKKSGRSKDGFKVKADQDFSYQGTKKQLWKAIFIPEIPTYTYAEYIIERTTLNQWDVTKEDLKKRLDFVTSEKQHGTPSWGTSNGYQQRIYGLI